MPLNEEASTALVALPPPINQRKVWRAVVRRTSCGHLLASETEGSGAMLIP